MRIFSPFTIEKENKEMKIRKGITTKNENDKPGTCRLKTSID